MQVSNLSGQHCKCRSILCCVVYSVRNSRAIPGQRGIWVHQLTAAAACSAANSRNIKPNSILCSQIKCPPFCSPSSIWQTCAYQDLDLQLQGSKFQLRSLRSLELAVLKHAHCQNWAAGPMNVLCYWLFENIWMVLSISA